MPKRRDTHTLDMFTDWEPPEVAIRLPEELATHRVTTIRWRLYGMAAKVVRTGRQLWVKLQYANRHLLDQVLAALRRFEPPPL